MGLTLKDYDNLIKKLETQYDSFETDKERKIEISKDTYVGGAIYLIANGKLDVGKSE